MLYQQTTQVPNYFFDECLKTLTEAEVKVFLVVLRQTLGWFNKKTGKRKERDRITMKWFLRATGLSPRGISKAISSLCLQKHILITDYQGKQLLEAKERRGKTYLYYAIRLPQHLATPTSAQNTDEPQHKTSYNKTNCYKTNWTKPRIGKFQHIGSILQTTTNRN